MAHEKTLIRQAGSAWAFIDSLPLVVNYLYSSSKAARVQEDLTRNFGKWFGCRQKMPLISSLLGAFSLSEKGRINCVEMARTYPNSRIAQRIAQSLRDWVGKAANRLESRNQEAFTLQWHEIGKRMSNP